VRLVSGSNPTTDICYNHPISKLNNAMQYLAQIDFETDCTPSKHIPRENS